MLNWFKKSETKKLVTKDIFSNYVLDVRCHQDELIKLSKKYNRQSKPTFEVKLIPDLNIKPPVVRVLIGKKIIGYLRNNVGYRFLKEIGDLRVTCRGEFQRPQMQDDGSLVEVGVLLNCKTPFSILNKAGNEQVKEDQFHPLSRLFQQSPLDNI